MSAPDQFVIIDGKNPKDAESVRMFLTSAAAKFGLRDNTFTSRAPETLCSFTATSPETFGIGGRMLGEDLIVDLNPRIEKTASYLELHDYVERHLFLLFEERCRRSNKETWIPWHTS